MISTPRASGSVLLAGSANVAAWLCVLMYTARNSAPLNSTSRSIHQDPITNVARGGHGPPRAHGAHFDVRLGNLSRMRPSHRFDGPMPLRQLRTISVSALCAALGMWAPLRSAVARAWYKYRSADLYPRHFKAAANAWTTLTVNGTNLRPKQLRNFKMVFSLDLAGPRDDSASTSRLANARASAFPSGSAS